MWNPEYSCLKSDTKSIGEITRIPSEWEKDFDNHFAVDLCLSSDLTLEKNDADFDEKPLTSSEGLILHKPNFIQSVEAHAE